ncbi:MAG: M20/M25/M40 family metallo-hydrolase [Lachnospiraceae bacterium]|nr:M20/M25/M40 family metallo-hydrolase [Lachnospiraceae bacterium]
MVSEARLFKSFQDIVAIDAESYHEHAMGLYIKKALKARGLTVTEDQAGETLKKRCQDPDADPSGNLFAVLPATGPGDPILFAAHLDTVKPGRGRKAIVHEDGTITSAGDTVLGADDGVGLAEILEFLDVLAEDTIPHPEIQFLIASAEEPYAQGSKLFDYSVVTAKSAYVLDLDGPIGTAAIAAPSILAFSIDVFGKSAHAGFHPEDGVHAISIAGEAISRITQGHIDPETTINIGTIEGGTARNIVPDHVYLTGEVRSLVDEKATAAYETMMSLFERASAYRGGNVTGHTEKAFQALSVPRDSATVRRFQRACEDLKIPVRLTTTFGGSDNNHIVEHGIPGIVIACGYENAHTVREYASLTAMRQTVEIMLQMSRSNEMEGNDALQ